MQVSAIGINKNGSNDISFRSGINAENMIGSTRKAINPTSAMINSQIDKLAIELSEAPMDKKPGIRLKMANLALKLAGVSKN